MSIKKSSKNNLKNSEQTLFRLSVILAKICTKLDQEGLKTFIHYSSAFLEDQDFQKVFKLSREFIKNSSKDGISCDDWLIENLYLLYNNGAEFF